MRRILEICCTNFESAKIAELGGADRIELCANIFEGGTTPSDGMIKAVVDALSIDVYVLIRPRGGDFVYSDQEFDIMLHDIRRSVDLGAKGIVSGVLNPDYTIDIERTNLLIKAADAAEFTFHRAFDLVEDQFLALEQLKSIGAHRVLTSGGKANVEEGADRLAELVLRSEGAIKILAGGGLKSTNVVSVLGAGCSEFHTTAKQWVDSPTVMLPKIPMNGSKDIPENELMMASLEEIKGIRAAIDEY